MATTTFFPDPDPESTSVDGFARRSGVDEAWSTIRGGAGTSSNDSAAVNVARVNASTTTDQYAHFDRGASLFDTSSIPDSDVISSATFSIFGSSSTSSFDAIDLGLVSVSLASNTALANGDFAVANWGSTRFAPDLVEASWSDVAYNDFVLNATGRANIDKTGVSDFAVRMVSDIDDNEPTWSSAGDTQVVWVSADETGTATDPKLVVTHAAAGVGIEILRRRIEGY